MKYKLTAMNMKVITDRGQRKAAAFNLQGNAGSTPVPAPKRTIGVIGNTPVFQTGVIGSSPLSCSFALVAQLVERPPVKRMVTGSKPVRSA